MFNVLEPNFCTLWRTKKSPWVCFSFVTHGSSPPMMWYLNRFYCQSASVQMGRNTTSVERDKIPGNTEGFLTVADENIPAHYVLDGVTFYLSNHWRTQQVSWFRYCVIHDFILSGIRWTEEKHEFIVRTMRFIANLTSVSKYVKE